jgi:predicted ester cyclase
MGTEENKAVMRRWIDQVLNGGDLEAMDHFLAPDLVNHSVRQGTGPSGLKDITFLTRAAFPDIHFTADLLLAEGETVVVRYTVRGTHQNLVILDVPPTGTPVEWTGIALYRFENGKIVETWGDWDDVRLFQQLGAIPALAPPA